MDHFENFEELIKTCKMWIRDDDIDAYYRFFEFNCMKTLVTAYEKEKEENKRLEKFIENGEYTWKQKYNETFEYFKQELKEKEVENKRLRKCHLQYEEITGIDLLLPEKEE